MAARHRQSFQPSSSPRSVEQRVERSKSRARQSLPAHLERVVLRLTSARAGVARRRVRRAHRSRVRGARRGAGEGRAACAARRARRCSIAWRRSTPELLQQARAALDEATARVACARRRGVARRFPRRHERRRVRARARSGDRRARARALRVADDRLPSDRSTLERERFPACPTQVAFVDDADEPGHDTPLTIDQARRRRPHDRARRRPRRAGRRRDSRRARAGAHRARWQRRRVCRDDRGGRALARSPRAVRRSAVRRLPLRAHRVSAAARDQESGDRRRVRAHRPACRCRRRWRWPRRRRTATGCARGCTCAAGASASSAKARTTSATRARRVSCCRRPATLDRLMAAVRSIGADAVREIELSENVDASDRVVRPRGGRATRSPRRSRRSDSGRRPDAGALRHRSADDRRRIRHAAASRAGVLSGQPVPAARSRRARRRARAGRSDGCRLVRGRWTLCRVRRGLARRKSDRSGRRSPGRGGSSRERRDGRRTTDDGAPASGKLRRLVSARDEQDVRHIGDRNRHRRSAAHRHVARGAGRRAAAARRRA